MTTELNSITNGNNAISSVGGTSGVFNNVVGTTNLDGNPYGKVEFNMAAYSGTPSTGGSIYLWFLFDVDGTDYENGGASVTPARNPDLVIPVNATASGPQRVTKRISNLPVGTWFVLFQNNTGITLAASGNTIKILASTDTGQ
jgi:hypothetical protein